MGRVGPIGVIIFFLLLPVFVKNTYFLNVVVFIFLNCILAVVLLPVFNSRMFCAATAAFMAIGAYTSALLALRVGMKFWFAFPISASLTGLIAVLIGLPTLRIKGLYFFLITFGLNEIVGLGIKNWRSLTGGSDGISGIPPPNTINILGLKVDFASPFQYYYFAFLLALAVVVIIYRIWKSRIGKICRGIASADLLSESVGINIFRHKMFVFVIYGFFTGLAGSFYAHYYSFLSPADFTIWTSIYPIIYLQVGGISSVAGPIVGGITLTVLGELFRSLSIYQPIAFGVVIIIVMRFFPEGIIGIYTRCAMTSKRLH